MCSVSRIDSRELLRLLSKLFRYMPLCLDALSKSVNATGMGLIQVEYNTPGTGSIRL